MKLTHLFCAAQIDLKVKEEEDIFVILMAEHNLPNSYGDVLMKGVKRIFHRPKSCQEHKQMCNKIQWPEQGNASFCVLVCY